MKKTSKDGIPRKTRGVHKKTTVSFSFEPVFEDEYIIQDMLQQLNKFCNQLVQCDLQCLCPASVEGTLTVKLQDKDITKQQILDAFNQPCEDFPEVMEEVKRIIRGQTKNTINTINTAGFRHPDCGIVENIRRIKEED